MFAFRRSFQTRLERRLVVLFFGFCILPLVVITGATVRVIESQTLSLAKRHLAEHAKSYAMQVIDRLDVAVWELSRTPAGGGADGSEVWRWIEPLASSPAPQDVAKPLLVPGQGGFRLSVVVGDRLRVGRVDDEILFEDLDHAPYGVRTCVRVASQTRRCGGPEASGRLVEAGWKLALATVYDTDVVIDVVSTQPEEVALSHIGVLYRVLPYLVFSIMAIAGWWVLAQLRASFAPVAELRRATERVQEGDYSQTVSIASGDELERLGDAFNAMTGRLQRSFTIMQTLAEMDRMALSGAQVEDLVRAGLALLDRLELPGGLVWLWNSEERRGEASRLDSRGRLQRWDLSVRAAPEDGEESLVAALREAWSEPVTQWSVIRRDGVLCGVIGCASADADGGSALAELGDRLSVAATLFSRANDLYRQAQYDALTGLLSRDAFTEHLERAARSAAREQRMGALVCLDLDRFKQVNDTLGHDIGDHLLARIGERLQHAVRGTDVVARQGGDEFAVLLPHLDDTTEIEMLCRRLMTEINRPVDIDGQMHVTEASLGIVVFPDDGDSAAVLLRKADVAMYKAKEQSGCSFAFFDALTNQATEQRAATENRLRQGLASRELCLHFQPKIRVGDGKVVGVEGLLRWPAAPGMHPGIFIPVAEQTGLIHDFTRILVEDGKACIDRCRAAGFDIDRVGVNISPRQFQRQGFVDEFLGLLSACDADPSDFEIEITESIFVHHPEAVACDLQALRAAGISIALDDFGTGYSSLNVLRELPLDVIKIDRSFVSPVSGSPQARDFLGRIIDIIRSLELTSVAEGVETEQEMQILAAKQCDVVQGFLFSPALPIEKLLSFLDSRNRTARSA